MPNDLKDYPFKPNYISDVDHILIFIRLHNKKTYNTIVMWMILLPSTYILSFSPLPLLIFTGQVDGVRMNLPLELDDGEVQAYQSGLVITLQTHFGLKVTYDTRSMVRVEMPSSYQGTLLGLCGNYNSNPGDDFVLPGGEQATSAEAFTNGWVVAEKGVKCQTGCGGQCPSPPPTDKQDSKDKCDILKDTKGPFAKCHATVPPQTHFDECVKDLSEQGGKDEVLCQHLQNYVAVCQEAGASVDLWRNDTFCRESL